MRVLILGIAFIALGCDKTRQKEIEQQQPEHKQRAPVEAQRMLDPKIEGEPAVVALDADGGRVVPAHMAALTDQTDRAMEAWRNRDKGDAQHSRPCDKQRARLKLAIDQNVVKGCPEKWERHAIALTKTLAIDLNGDTATEPFLQHKGRFVSATPSPEGCRIQLEFLIPEVKGGLSYELIDGAGVVNGTIWLWDHSTPKSCGHGFTVIGYRD